MKQLLLISLLISFASTGQISPDLNYIESEKWEIWHDEIPVSGGMKVGLMVNENTNDQINPEVFYVDLPELSNETIWIEISSKDGRYSAKLPYLIESIKKGIQQLKLPTNHHKQLKAYTMNEVVILATLETPEEPIYCISSWKENINYSEVCLYLNSSLPTGVEQGRVQCEELPTPAVAYNKRCVLDIDSLDDIITIKQRVEKMGRISVNTYKMKLIR